MKLKAVLYIGLLSLGVGCSNNDPRLDGEREMLDGSVFVESDARFVVESLPALNLPDARRNTQWTHQGGNAQHYSGHLELADDVSLEWSTSIGHGDGRRHQSLLLQYFKITEFSLWTAALWSLPSGRMAGFCGRKM